MVRYKNLNSALSSCDFERDCDGVVDDHGSYFLVGGIQESTSTIRSDARFGKIITKLNQIVDRILDSRTTNTMLVEQWTSSSSNLVHCTHTEYGRCSSVFDTEFEAKYYCEGLGAGCAGVLHQNGKFKTMKDTTISESSTATSTIKAEWCSNSAPPLTIELPTVFRQANNVVVMWSVVDLSEVFSLIDETDTSERGGLYNQTDLFQTEFERYALNIKIEADTVILRRDITAFNVQSLSIIARKLIIENSVTVKLKQVQSVPVWWPNLTAPLPDLSPNGLHGEAGSDGFDGAQVTVDVGCINSNGKSLTIELHSGKELFVFSIRL